MAICAIFCVSAAYAQSVTIHGKAVDKADSSALQFVTVAVFDGSGTAVAGTSTAEDGSFSITADIQADSLAGYSILLSFVGYRDVVVTPWNAGASDGTTVTVELGTVVMEADSEMIEGAAVSGKRPLIEHRYDKIVLNVSELATAQTGNALEVLKSSPGVTVDKDGNIRLNGTDVAVWIDDRPSQMSGKDLEAFLQGSPGSSIDKVELISSPSSKYDAEGSGGIINIRTRKGFMKGFNGTINARYGMGFGPGTSFSGNVSANVMYRTDRTSTFLQYTPGGNTNYAEILESKRYGPDDSWRQETSSLVKGSSFRHNIRVGNDWNITGNDVIGFIAGANFSNERLFSPSPASIRDYRTTGDGTPYMSVLNSHTDNIAPGVNWSANLNYTRTFDRSRSQELTLNADYNRKTSDVRNVQRNIYDRELSDIEAQEDAEDYGFDDVTVQEIDIWAFRADYSQAFWNGRGKLEGGVKASVSATDNRFGKYIYDFSTGQPGDMTERNDFTYSEQIYAAYANISGQFSQKWNAQAGIRGEYTIQDGNWMKGADSPERTYRNYMDVFPTAFVSYMPSQKAILTLNYSYRISRPKYWQMNPYRIYVNATTYNVGNPELEPFYSHNVSFSAVLFGKLSLTAGYSHEKNYSYTQVPLFDPETGTIGMSYDNAGVQQSAYAGVYLTEFPLFRWWNLTLNGTYCYSFFRAYPGVDGGTFGSGFSNRGGAFSMYGSTTFFLPESFKISVDGWMLTPMTQGYFTTGLMGSGNISLTKSMYEGKLSVTGTASNVFSPLATEASIMKGGIVSYHIRQQDSSAGFLIGLTWRFGQAAGEGRRNVGKLEEADRL